MNSTSTFFRIIVLIFLFCSSESSAQYGLSFNGSSQYVTMGSAAGLGSSSFTLECWVYRAGTGVGASTGSGGISSGIPLIAKGRGEADGSNLDMNYFFGINTSNNFLCADFEEGTGQSSPGLNHPVYGVTPICNNVWYHAAVTYDGTTWKIYLNGNLETTLAVNRLPQSLSIQHASIASALNSSGTASGYFNGKMDEVRIWNVARTQTEIQNNLALQITSATGLTGRYSLNENTGTVATNTGSAGTAVNGNLINTPLWISGSTFSPLNSNSALQFGGTNSYVTFGNNAALGLSQFTLECWFRKEGSGTNASSGSGGVTAKPLITKGRNEADGSTKDMNYFLGINSSNSKLCADFEEGAGQPSPGLNHPVYGTTVIQNNVWYHATATYDGSTWKLYLNGNLEATLAVNRTPQSASIQHASIGSSLSSTGVGSGYFYGRIDEARIWNYARSQGEIQSTINSQITSAQSGLVSRWGMNDNCAATIAGIGATTINGTVTGSNWNWNSGAPFNISVACAIPTSLTVNNLLTTSATLNWSSVSTAVSYSAQYREVGSSNWIINSSAVNSISITGLTALTNYEWQVQSNCAGGSSGFSSSSSFITAGTDCAAPSSLSSIGITTNTANILWGNVGGANSYNIQYRQAGAASWNSFSSTANSALLSSLFSSTQYEWQVQAVCGIGPSVFSVSGNFTTLASPAVLVRGAYLNSVSQSGIVIRWRTDIATDSKVSFGSTLGNYNSSIVNTSVTTEHIVQLGGLTAATKYFYQIGNSNTVLQGDGENYFYTSPVAGTVTPVRVWALGDFGAGTTIESQVRDAYMTNSGSTYTNLFIWLGDNAYETGTDANYQANVFGYFGNQFKKFPVMPSPGNHEYANVGYQSASALTTNWAYFDNFSMPTAAEAGGIASGTEKYYSYNYANIHFITLDSYGALNNSSSPMYQWLVSDLASNTQRWTVVYFHHAPYTMGSHNSDTEAELIAMRQNINPVLELYHVDLVLCGHSHVNERSYLIKGHYGLENTFTSAMKMSTATNTFTKAPPYDGTIYVVAGTGGKAPGTIQSGWPMPCMYYSNNTLNCSVMLDINGDNLSCKFIATDGSIPDQFTITKTGTARYENSRDESLSGLNVYPNPTADEFTLFYELMKDGNVDVKLMDITGRIIEGSERTVYQNPGGYRMNFNKNEFGLSSGIYLLSISVNEKQYVRKVIIE